MENNENIKKTNKALIVSNVILGCLLIIAMAFLAISIVNGNNVTADAAAENLLKEPLQYSEMWNIEDMKTIEGLSLEIGKSYIIEGYFGGESLDNNEGATPFNVSVTATSGAEMTGFETTKILNIELPVSDDSNDGNIGVEIIDGCYVEDEVPIEDSTKALIIVNFTGVDSARPLAKNFVLESITSLSNNNEQNLDAGSIIGNITGSFTGFLTGTGSGIVNLFETLYLNEDGGISIFAIVSLSMIGLGLAIGIIKILLTRTNI